jgi:hypothetical protein
MVVGVSWSGVGICWGGLAERFAHEDMDIARVFAALAPQRHRRESGGLVGPRFEDAAAPAHRDSIRPGDESVECANAAVVADLVGAFKARNGQPYLGGHRRRPLRSMRRLTHSEQRHTPGAWIAVPQSRHLRGMGTADNCRNFAGVMLLPWACWRCSRRGDDHWRRTRRSRDTVVVDGYGPLPRRP